MASALEKALAAQYAGNGPMFMPSTPVNDLYAGMYPTGPRAPTSMRGGILGALRARARVGCQGFGDITSRGKIYPASVARELTGDAVAEVQQ